MTSFGLRFARRGRREVFKDYGFRNPIRVEQMHMKVLDVILIDPLGNAVELSDQVADASHQPYYVVTAYATDYLHGVREGHIYVKG
jgi:hypothetical protein